MSVRQPPVERTGYGREEKGHMHACKGECNECRLESSIDADARSNMRAQMHAKGGTARASDEGLSSAHSSGRFHARSQRSWRYATFGAYARAVHADACEGMQVAREGMQVARGGMQGTCGQGGPCGVDSVKGRCTVGGALA